MYASLVLTKPERSIQNGLRRSIGCVESYYCFANAQVELQDTCSATCYWDAIISFSSTFVSPCDHSPYWQHPKRMKLLSHQFSFLLAHIRSSLWMQPAGGNNVNLCCSSYCVHVHHFQLEFMFFEVYPNYKQGNLHILINDWLVFLSFILTLICEVRMQRVWDANLKKNIIPVIKKQ